MAKWHLAGSTAVALFIGGAASAQVTPEEVWQNWKDMGTAYGQTLTSTAETRDGDTLVVEGLALSFDQDGTVVNGTIDEINLTDNGDGTVEITMSDTYPLDMTFPAAEGETEATTMTILVSQPGIVLTASGTPAALSYEYDAPTMNIKVDEIEGVDAEAVDLTLDFTLTALAGSYLVSGEGAAKSIDSSVTAGSLAIVADATDPDTSDTFSMTANVADLASQTNGNLIGMASMANLSEAIKAGFQTDGSFTYGATTMQLDFTEATAPTSISAESDTGSFDFAIGPDGLSYGFGGTGTEMTISGAEIPFPEVAIAYGQSLFDFSMPVTPSDTPTPFVFVTKLVDLTVSEEVWAMIDPVASLPRDPATVIIDTTGTARLTADIFDPVVAETLGDTAPGELYSLDVNEVRATIAGAELTGNGAFTFDNTDTTTFQGMPAPTGKIDMKLTGGNALIDKLVSMGLLPEDQAMGARMMLGMFARPGDGDDTLVSTIEFKDKGLFANGQKLQ